MIAFDLIFDIAAAYARHSQHESQQSTLELDSILSACARMPPPDQEDVADVQAFMAPHFGGVEKVALRKALHAFARERYIHSHTPAAGVHNAHPETATAAERAVTNLKRAAERERAGLGKAFSELVK